MPPLTPPKIELSELRQIIHEESEILNGSRHAVFNICEKFPECSILARRVNGILHVVRLELGKIVETDKDAEEANIFIQNVRKRVDEELLGIEN